ncbi:2-C-methyl-D-erythritol 4-phosphate cytidylyltransferase [Cylindrospermum stagnale PCC 7417]|uniref:2-C-methyl-D-erythritol 4-phosphate cytidylyltransferase n=1 Tax=Cylindrospermum stagnale PCC 7417 TaxID=56107 RepID=K9X1B0_9NOST|nr:2-C-methyl-D-erythritol 4-phosphate cytidylyltransferase [Cylindrospermum stagnale]AFZ26405.1 2-C-methyl-D-erythritol 4-phosphate cytidylyltransferase [Cylindrospermum stagnale PCC 7417]
MYLLIPAAGIGTRMGSDRNKLLLKVLAQPIIAWTLLAAQAAREIDWIGIISQPSDWPDLKAILADLNLTKPVELIAGGATRQESVYNGLQALPAAAEQVLIHDGARCLATPDLLNACATAIRDCPGLIAAVAVKDTIKVVDENGIIQSTPDRRQLWAAQTPQGFNVKLLKQCHAEGVRQNWQVTDDAALFEKCGIEVRIVQGEETNLKVTTPQDLAIAEFILNSRTSRHLPTHS